MFGLRKIGLLVAFCIALICTSKAAVIYVNVAATGANTGVSWTDAYTDLCDALRNANGGDEIWVVQGAYLPTRDRTYAFLPVGNRQQATFMLKQKVSVYGGFIGTETLRSQRDPATNTTTLSGDHNGNDNGNLTFSNPLLSDNSYTVVTASDMLSGEFFDGFHIVSGASVATTGGSNIESGAGMYITNRANFSIENCEFHENTAYLNGGGLFIEPVGTNALARVYFSNTKVYNNKARIQGSGIAVYSRPNTTVSMGGEYLEISNNQLCQNGSALSQISEKASAIKTEFIGLVISENQSSGGTIFNKPRDNGSIEMQLVNALIVRNTAAKVGSVFFNDSRKFGYCAIKMINCTVADNQSPATGVMFYSAGYGSGQCTTSITNTIFDGNQSSQFGAYGGAVYAMDYCLIDAAACPAGVICGTNMFYNQNPGFTNQVANDYTTSATSFGADQGDNAALAGVTQDLLGNTRIQNGTVDLGPYEATPCPSIIYVNAVATGANDGSNWTNAFLDLQDALSLARTLSCVQEIWVAAGTYTPAATDRTILFDLVNDVDMYGGFPNTGNPTMADRDVVVHQSILSGEINGPTRTDNSYHIFRANNFSNHTIFDGFRIERGYYKLNNNTNSLPSSYGAGRWHGPGKISNCVFDNNFSFYYAGALTAITVEIDKCTFQNNEAPWRGGALEVQNNVVVKNCRFYNNGSAGGGAVHMAGQSAFYNCIFKNNFARTPLYWSHSTGNPFSDNFAQGGAFYHNPYAAPYTGPLKMINCTFFGNYGVNAQGGTFATEDAGPGMQLQFFNCIIRNSNVSGNQCEDPFGSGMFNAPCMGPIGTSGTPGAVVDFYDCNLQSTSSGQFTWNVATNFYGNTQTTNPQFNNTGTNDFRLQATSPSINAGNSTHLPTWLTEDIAGNTRINGASVDMGAYENYPGSQQRVIFVNPLATGANNGSNWKNAFISLQDALNNSHVDGSLVNEIWLAEGTYYPTDDNDRTRSFEFKKGLKIYGGFRKKGNPDFNDRDPERYPTVLSGDIGKKGDRSDNSRHIGTMVVEDEIMLMRGVTIEGGNANGDGQDGKGGGLLVVGKNSNVELLEVNIANCYAKDAGGAIYGTNAQISLRNSVIENNNCQNQGAAIFSENGTVHSSRNSFIQNQSVNGSIIHCSNAQLKLFNDHLTQNTSANGLVVIRTKNSEYASHSISGSLFDQNECFDGSLIQIENDSKTTETLTVVNTSFVGNESYNSDGAILHYNGSMATVDQIAFGNCLFSQNILKGFVSDPNNPNYQKRPEGLVSWVNHAKLSFFDCALPGEDLHIENPGLMVERQAYGNMIYLKEDPINPSFQEDYLKGSKSESLSFLVDAGNKAHLNTDMQTDLLGNDRIQGSTVDIGAIELSADSASSINKDQIAKNRLSVSVFPNPCTTSAQLEWSLPVQGNLQLVNLQGQTVRELDVHGVRSTLSTAQLPAGLYKVILDDQNGVRIQTNLVVGR